jgi:hypothetical protein
MDEFPISSKAKAVVADLIAKRDQAQKELTRYVEQLGFGLGVPKGYGFDLDRGVFVRLKAPPGMRFTPRPHTPGEA